MITEIKSSEWPAFCQRLTKDLAGAMVKLESTAADGTKSASTANATLTSLIFDGSDGCNDVIRLRLANSHEIVHEIIEPIHVRVHASKTPDDFNPLEIVAESGVTLITFHPAIRSSMLK
jgi:hypothetical protein